MNWESPDADLPVAYALKTYLAMAVIRASARIKTGAKTEDARFLKKSGIVMSATKNVEKAY